MCYVVIKFVTPLIFPTNFQSKTIPLPIYVSYDPEISETPIPYSLYNLKIFLYALYTTIQYTRILTSVTVLLSV